MTTSRQRSILKSKEPGEVLLEILCPSPFKVVTSSDMILKLAVTVGFLSEVKWLFVVL